LSLSGNYIRLLQYIVSEKGKCGKYAEWEVVSRHQEIPMPVII
jgi:hypothetical protein